MTQRDGRRAITISRPVREPVWRMRVRARESNQHLFTGGTRPLTIEGDGWTVRCRHWALPLASESVDEIEIVDTLEFVRNDLALYREIDRILRPGGSIRLRVPNAGPLAGLDSLNLYRYLTDVTRRGLRTPESDEIGFRRHLALREVEEALGPGFATVRAWTRGLAIAELVNLPALVGLTWWPESADRYLRVKPVIERFERAEGKVRAGRMGFWLWVELRKG